MDTGFLSIDLHSLLNIAMCISCKNILPIHFLQFRCIYEIFLPFLNHVSAVYLSHMCTCTYWSKPCNQNACPVFCGGWFKMQKYFWIAFEFLSIKEDHVTYFYRICMFQWLAKNVFQQKLYPFVWKLLISFFKNGLSLFFYVTSQNCNSNFCRQEHVP